MKIIAAKKAKTVWVQSRGKVTMDGVLAKYKMVTIRKNSTKRVNADLEALLGRKLSVKINNKSASCTIIGVRLLALPFFPERRCSAITLVACDAQKNFIHICYWSCTYPVTIGVMMNSFDKFMSDQKWALAHAFDPEFIALLLAEELKKAG